MENFVVSARKYRPNLFDNVVGQESITKTLENAIHNNHLAQAFLFCGPRGVGKTTCARILAKMVNNQEGEHHEDEDFSFNIFELDAASNNGVDDIRAITDQVRIPPQIGDYKIYIIDEVHMLSQAAFNAFLKTLEEPPPHAIFILATTEKHKILPTILSRCQIFDFKRIEVDDIIVHLKKIADQEKVNVEDKALHIIAQKADGALRDALSIFDQVVSFSGNEVKYQDVIENLNVLDYDYYFKITAAVYQKDISTTLLAYNDILNKGFDGHHFIVGLAEHLRDLLVCKNKSTLQLLEVSDDVKEQYYEQANLLDDQAIYTLLEICTKCDVNYKAAKNQRLHVEFALIKMCSIALSGTAVPEKKNDSFQIIRADTELKPAAKLEPEKKPNIQEVPIIEEAPIIQNLAAEPSVPLTKKDTPKQDPARPNPEVVPMDSLKKSKLFDTSSAKGIASLVKPKKVEEEEKVEDNQPSGPEDPFDIDQLQNQWKAFLIRLESENDKGFFYNAMSLIEPELNPKTYAISFKLKNATEEKEWNSRLPDLLAFLREKLNNYSLSIQWSIEEKSDKPRYYTNRDRFTRIAEKNPKVLDLKKRLDLELE